jgi:hypothetical protein
MLCDHTTVRFEACNDLQVEIRKITLGDDETVTQFVHHTRNLVANIQIISELLKEKILG